CFMALFLYLPEAFRRRQADGPACREEGGDGGRGRDGEHVEPDRAQVRREPDHAQCEPGPFPEGKAAAEIDELGEPEAQADAYGRPDEPEERALQDDERQDAPPLRAEGAERAPLAHALEDDPVHRVAEDEEGDEEDDRADD